MFRKCRRIFVFFPCFNALEKIPFKITFVLGHHLRVIITNIKRLLNRMIHFEYIQALDKYILLLLI